MLALPSLEPCWGCWPSSSRPPTPPGRWNTGASSDSSTSWLSDRSVLRHNEVCHSVRNIKCCLLLLYYDFVRLFRFLQSDCVLLSILYFCIMYFSLSICWSVFYVVRLSKCLSLSLLSKFLPLYLSVCLSVCLSGCDRDSAALCTAVCVCGSERRVGWRQIRVSRRPSLRRPHPRLPPPPRGTCPTPQFFNLPRILDVRLM